MKKYNPPLALIDQLKRHEGLMLKLYRCPAGKLSIGYGRNLEANGVFVSEAETMLENDIQEAYRAASAYLGEGAFSKLSDVRQCVLINMAFNLGLSRLRKFIGMRAALLAGDYERAALSMENSLWSAQVKNRAKELISMMRLNKWRGQM